MKTKNAKAKAAARALAEARDRLNTGDGGTIVTTPLIPDGQTSGADPAQGSRATYNAQGERDDMDSKPRADRFTWKPGDIIFGAPSTTAEAAQAQDAQAEEPELLALERGLRRRLGVVMGDTVTGIPKSARWVWGKMRAQAVRNARLEAEVKRLRALLREAGKGKAR